MALAGKFRKSVLLTHNETDSHLSCVKAGKRDKVTHIADGEAPAAKAFEDLVARLANDSASTLREHSRQTFCLAEAVKSLNQERVLESRMLTVMRDESHGRLTCRYRAVTSNLVVHSGYLGTVVGGPQDAQAITSATDLILRNFSSRYLLVLLATPCVSPSSRRICTPI